MQRFYRPINDAQAQPSTRPKMLPKTTTRLPKVSGQKGILGHDTYPASAGQPVCSKRDPTAARRKNRGTNQTLFAQMPGKLLEAGRANALKGMPMKKEGTPYL
jgi:hypothetical protein